MSNNYVKTLVAIVIASMLAVAFAPLFTDDSGADAASDESTNYTIYVQLNDGKSEYAVRAGNSAQPDVSKASLVNAVRETCTKAGMTVDYSDGAWMKSITVEDTVYATAGTWEKSPYYSFAQYYLNDKGEWALTNTFDEGTVWTMVYGEYKFEEPSDAENYVKAGSEEYGYYWVPACKTTTNVYTIFLQLNNGTKSVTEKLGSSVQPTVSKSSLSAAINELCDMAEYEVDYKNGWAKSITVDGVTYAKSGEWGGSTPYWGFAQYYLNSDNEWALINDYTEGTTVTLVFGEYKFSEPADAENYFKSGSEEHGFYWVPAVKFTPVNYEIYLQLNDGTNKFTGRVGNIMEMNKSKDSLIDAVEEVCALAGIPVSYEGAWAKSITVDGVTYATSGTWQKSPYFTFAQYFYIDDEWKLTSTFDEGTTFCLVYGEHMFTEPADAENYVKQGDETYGYYWVPACKITFGESSSFDFTLPLAIVGIVVLAGILVVLLKKRSA